MTLFDPGERMAAGASLAVGSFVVLSQPTAGSTWLGSPQDTLLFLSVYAFALAGGLAVLGAGASARTAALRLRAGADLPGIRPERVLGRRFARSLVLVWASVGFVMVVALLRDLLLVGSLRLPPVAVLALPFLASAWCVGLGVVVGLLTRSWVAVSMAAVTPYAVILVAGQNDSVWWRALPFVDERWDPDRTAAASTLLRFEAGWMVLILLAVWASLLRAGRAGRRRWGVGPALGLVAGGLSAFALLAVPTVDDERSRPLDPTSRCAALSGHSVCWWRTRDWLAPRYEAALRSVSERLDGVDPLPWTWVEDGLPAPPGAVRLPTVTAAPTASELGDELVAAVVSALGDPRCGSDAQEALMRSAVYADLVAGSADGESYKPARSLAAALLSGPPSARQAWASEAHRNRCIVTD